MWQHTEGMVGFVENLLGFPAVKVFSATFAAVMYLPLLVTAPVI